VVYVEAHGTHIALNAGHEEATIGQKPEPGNSKNWAMQEPVHPMASAVRVPWLRPQRLPAKSGCVE
jgi:hypothetical protein